MGIDANAIKFLRFATKRNPLGSVATMGRQGLYLSASELQRSTDAESEKDYGEFCEQFLIERLGASSVESFDYSNYEGATHVADLNEPIALNVRYDTIVDCGTLEHVFNVAQALKNVINLCKVGGQIIHIVPCNNFSNHGFWQFSPELFFALYSDKNGFTDTKVFLHDVGEPSFWRECLAPQDGYWDYFSSSRALYVMAVTTKTSNVDSLDVQQTICVGDWHGAPRPDRKADVIYSIKSKVIGTPVFRPLRAIYQRMRDPDRSMKRNRNLRKVKIAELLNA